MILTQTIKMKKTFSQVGVCQWQAASHRVQQGWSQQAGQTGGPAVDQGQDDATFLILVLDKLFWSKLTSPDVSGLRLSKKRASFL